VIEVDSIQIGFPLPRTTTLPHPIADDEDDSAKTKYIAEAVERVADI
jgi:hypothetical protein